jgi:UDP-N-acetylmuramoyl-tripeptide--D-alanyl-D-alanine ligase
MIDGFWTLRRAATALGVQCPDDRALSGVSTDTRSIASGDLFVALRGERFDAHNYLADAVARGAAALVVEDGSKAAGVGVPVLVVDDTLVALGALGRYHRVAWSRPVIAIGGSNGKTTTKELVRAALSSALVVHATEANLNNRIGAPATLLGLSERADIAVVEVGTNQPGEIELLREIVRPDIALITTVQEEHLEGFGDLAGVMREELSLCNDVELAIVPAAEPAVAAEARKRARRVITVGLRMGDMSPDGWGLREDGTGWIELGSVTVRVPGPGAHNVANAMLAIAAARASGVSDADIARGIATVTMPSMRSSVVPLGTALLVNDAYNANPASMRAALDLLAAVGVGRTTTAILGTMRELGPRAPALHDDIARAVLESDITLIGAVGDFADAFARIAPTELRVVSAPDPDSLWERIAPRLDRTSAILLKGSRGVRLERLVPRLSEWAGVPLREEKSH